MERILSNKGRMKLINERKLQFFSGKCCRSCKATNNLQLHHRDPSTKIGRTQSIWSWCEKKRFAEIAKCDVLCRSCHNSHHKKEEVKLFPRNSSGKFIKGGSRGVSVQEKKCGTAYKYGLGCRCIYCRRAKYLYRRGLVGYSASFNRGTSRRN